MAKLGIFSDVHGNYEAFTTILACLDNEKCDDLICLGDVVGYCANPAECMQIMYERNIKCVLGNHDEYMTTFLEDDLKHLREDVRKSVAWTQKQLTFDDLDWFLKLPMERVEYGINFIHSSYAPHRWSYCLDERTYALNFRFQTAQLAFCGHSHTPTIAVELPNSALPYVDDIHSPFTIPDYSKVMVNVGSVGQPRDNDPRACCVTYDTETRVLNLIRAEYDVERAQKKILASPLPDVFGRRLSFGK